MIISKMINTNTATAGPMYTARFAKKKCYKFNSNWYYVECNNG